MRNLAHSNIFWHNPCASFTHRRRSRPCASHARGRAPARQRNTYNQGHYSTLFYSILLHTLHLLLTASEAGLVPVAPEAGHPLGEEAPLATSRAAVGVLLVDVLLLGFGRLGRVGLLTETRVTQHVRVLEHVGRATLQLLLTVRWGRKGKEMWLGWFGIVWLISEQEWTWGLRPPLNKMLFPVYRPGGSKRADWKFLLLFFQF